MGIVQTALRATQGVWKRDIYVKYLPGVWRYLRPHGRLVWISIALMITIALVGLLVPWPFKFLADYVITGAPLPAWLARWLGPLAVNRYAQVVLVAVSGFL